MSHSNDQQATGVVALDLGDRSTVLARREGDEIVFETLRTSEDGLIAWLAAEPPRRVVFEAGSQCHWIAWRLEQLGHVPFVVQPRRLRMITESSRKTDRADAEWLLRLAEADLDILAPVRLRGRRRQLDLALLRSRKMLVSMRAHAVQHVRGLGKVFGCALPSGSPACFPKRAREGLDAELRAVVEPMLAQIESLTTALAHVERRLETLADTRYRDTRPLRQVHSIGPLTSLAFVLTLQDPRRFRKSRDAGPVCGVVPKMRASGASDPELRITKSGDVELRRLLVLAAHRMMQRGAPDSDLRRFGEKLAARGGKNAKKRAVVAVARKLAVLLLALWKSGEVYEPLRQARIQAEREAARNAA